MITVDIVREGTSTNLKDGGLQRRKREQRDWRTRACVFPTEVMCEQHKGIKPSETSNNCYP